jgi:hypothetical protein
MFGAEFGEKCIIVHFLGEEKDGKSSQSAVRRENREARHPVKRAAFPNHRAAAATLKGSSAS